MGRGKINYNDRAHTFKRMHGVKMHTFKKMKDILDNEYEEMHRKGGSPPKMSVGDKLYAALKYLREYRTMESIAADYGVSKSTICESIQWVENTLTKDGTFKLPGKKVLKEADSTIEYIVIDVTESPVNRPKKTKNPIIQAKRSGIQ
jgi:transcription initiation factor TFIIIB Brf1 subunit/transcription initiation factor TFIIB